MYHLDAWTNLIDCFTLQQLWNSNVEKALRTDFVPLFFFFLTTYQAINLERACRLGVPIKGDVNTTPRIFGRRGLEPRYLLLPLAFHGARPTVIPTKASDTYLHPILIHCFTSSHPRLIHVIKIRNNLIIHWRTLICFRRPSSWRSLGFITSDRPVAPFIWKPARVTHIYTYTFKISLRSTLSTGRFFFFF